MASRKPRGKTPRKSRASGGAVDDGDLITLPEEPEPDPDENVTVDAITGVVTIEHEDGSVTVDPTGSTLWQQPDEPTTHDENLVLKIDPVELSRIAEEKLDEIGSDKQDRSQWEQMRAKCVELLGLKLEDPKGDVSRSSMGMSTSVVRDPVLLEAVERFRANAFAELCPAAGPVKVVRWGVENTAQKDELADALESDLNYYLTTTASEYYPDTRYMLWWTGLAGGTFKKVYRCPLRRRPVSEYVDGTALIVPSNATDLKNAGRVTHEVKMRKAVMRAMQLAGVYRDILLTDPLPPQINAVQAKAATIEGKAPAPQRIEDTEYTVYECYCELDIRGFEHKVKGKPTGLPLPYRVTIEETSRQILEIRRNWEEEDEGDEDDDEETIVKTPNIPFVLFPYSTGLSRIYGSGLGQMLGNLASALTALLRISIDNGILGNYPATISAKGTARQLTNELMLSPGSNTEMDTGGMPIQQFIMALPYKDISGNVAGFMEQLRAVAQRVGSTAELPVGEGKQDAPVGTTLAMIEQATKVEAGVHKGLHAAQAEEFRLLVNLFKSDPESLWRGNRRPKFGTGASQAERQARVTKFQQALDDCDIQPQSDPNVPSDIHRNLIALAFRQMVAPPPGAPPGPYNMVDIDKWVARQAFKMDKATFNSFLAPQGAPQPNPLELAAAAQLQIEKQKADTQQMDVQMKHHIAQKKLDQDGQIAAAELAADQQHKALDAMGKSQPTQQGFQPDPYKEAELHLKHRKQQLEETRLAVDTHNTQVALDSKEAVEAFKFATTAGVHPEAAGIMDNQLSKVGDFIGTAAAKSAADGGVMGAEEPSRDAKARAQEIIRQLEIERALHIMRGLDNAYSPYLQ